MRPILITLFSLGFALSALANGERMSRQDYIDTWKDEAIFQMVTHGIPASITLAQGILESADGNSELARKSNNHFGIKCHSDWQGKRAFHDDDKKGECFRVYETAHQSFEDHSAFLLRKRYAPLFELKTTDYKGWARGLKKCGYATNPKYANMLIRLVEDHDLTQYDKEGERMRKKGEVPERNIPQKGKKKKRKNDVTPTGDDIAFESESTSVALNTSLERSIMMTSNQVKYLTAQVGDSFDSISKDLDLMPWQLPKYNDLPRNAQLEEGQIIYLQPKRRKADIDQHTLKEGETLWEISQRFGIRMKHLLKYNSLDASASPPPGTVLKLR